MTYRLCKVYDHFHCIQVSLNWDTILHSQKKYRIEKIKGKDLLKGLLLS